MKYYLGAEGEVHEESMWAVSELPYLTEVEWDEEQKFWVEVDHAD